jgi:hypothetical protein
MSRADSRQAFLDNYHPPLNAHGGGGGNGIGEPGWVSGMRADIRGLGSEFSAAIRHQTLVIVLIAALAMILNTALVLASITFTANSSGVSLSTSNP